MKIQDKLKLVQVQSQAYQQNILALAMSSFPKCWLKESARVQCPEIRTEENLFASFLLGANQFSAINFS